MTARFELHKNDRGQFHFSLRNADGGVLLVSEGYASKASAENGIASVKKNCIVAERFEKRVADDGRLYFNLHAANHQVIGTSPMFKSAEQRDAAIAAIHADADKAAVDDRA
jgi:uncharacterized protein YegP (UPF0339 family)